MEKTNITTVYRVLVFSLLLLMAIKPSENNASCLWNHLRPPGDGQEI